MNLFRRPLFLLALAYIAGILCAAHANPNPFVGLGIAGGIDVHRPLAWHFELLKGSLSLFLR